jgi:6-pyruvoyl-tetrahydropterin synthase
VSVEIWTTVTIEVAHSSPAQGYPEVHGHSYWIQFFSQTSAESPTSLSLMQSEAKWVAGRLDHRNLDELLPSATMESIAQWCSAHWNGPALSRIIVRRESLGCGVEWRA